MGKKVIIKTLLDHPPDVLEYWWAPKGEPEPQRFPVKNGVITGLTQDHPRWVILRREWKLVVEEVGADGVGDDDAKVTREVK